MADTKKFNSKRYFQLTQNILLEYSYILVTPQEVGDSSNDIIDLETNNQLFLTQNSYNASQSIFFKDDAKHVITNNNYRNLVLPLNKSYSKFVKVYNEKTNKYYYDLQSDNLKTSKITFDNVDYRDVYFDTCTIHFTNSDYIGGYDALIFQANVTNIDGTKISLASLIHQRTDTLELNDKPMLINQKLYTTHISFKIPSTNFLVNNPNGRNGLLAKLAKLSPTYKKLQRNTPIEFNVFGVKGTYTDSLYTFYNTEQINTIQVPFYDSYNKLNIVIEQAKDGDYFTISAKISHNGHTNMSFSDYIKEIDDHPEAYIIMHDISLIENYVNDKNEAVSTKTHTEYYLVNMSFNETDESIDDVITYRPVCIYANKDVSFTIEDTLKIINTEDNTTIVKKASETFSNASKFGKYMSKIFVGATPTQINVYNKRTDEDIDYVNITHSKGGNTTKIDNHQYNITALTECRNIGVSIQQVSTQDVDNL